MDSTLRRLNRKYSTYHREQVILAIVPVDEPPTRRALTSLSRSFDDQKISTQFFEETKTIRKQRMHYSRPLFNSNNAFVQMQSVPSLVTRFAFHYIHHELTQGFKEAPAIREKPLEDSQLFNSSDSSSAEMSSYISLAFDRIMDCLREDSKEFLRGLASDYIWFVGIIALVGITLLSSMAVMAAVVGIFRLSMIVITIVGDTLRWVEFLILQSVDLFFDYMYNRIWVYFQLQLENRRLELNVDSIPGLEPTTSYNPTLGGVSTRDNQVEPREASQARQARQAREVRETHDTHGTHRSRRIHGTRETRETRRTRRAPETRVTHVDEVD